MLAFFQGVISFGLTFAYVLNNEIKLKLLDISKVILVFLGVNLIYTLIALMIFVLFIFLTEKLPGKALWKHQFYHIYNHYIFNFIFRAKPIILGKENLPKDNNFAVFSNHIEYTDPLYIKQVYKDYPLSFVAKDTLYKYPILKNIMVGTGCVSLSRKAGDRQALMAILEAIKQIKDGQPMAIFPEGTRSYSNDMIPFKTGAFKLAQKAKADISPVCLYDMHNLSKKFKLFRVKVYLKVLPVIKYDEYKDLDTVEISDMVYERINQELDKFKSQK